MRKVAIWGQLCEIATSQNIRGPAPVITLLTKVCNFLQNLQFLQNPQNSQILLGPSWPPLLLLLHCWQILQFFATFGKFAFFAKFADFVGDFFITSLTTLNYIVDKLYFFLQFSQNSQVLLEPSWPPLLPLKLNYWHISHFFAIFTKFAIFAEFADFCWGFLDHLSHCFLHCWQIL